ncbi:MAG: class I SAM-dependent methyltransferase [Thermoplasmata archaeon]|nr:class I SAM-dependent methyltransferase [Thermoplasmata archaeon]
MYDRGRPEYPQAAVHCLAERLGIGEGRRVLELGAGTGKFTRALARMGAEVIAVEPSEGMRAVFRERVPAVELRAGGAESIPLPNESVDAVLSAQAFHWFRQPQSLEEIARVLRPGGGLGLIWNLRDETVDWVAAFGRILDAYNDPAVPRTRQGAWKMAVEHHAGFAPLERASFPSSQDGDVPTFVDRALSVSFIARQPAEVRANVAEAIRALLASDPATAGRERITMPYVTEVYWTRRR